MKTSKQPSLNINSIMQDSPKTTLRLGHPKLIDNTCGNMPLDMFQDDESLGNFLGMNDTSPTHHNQ